MFHRRLLDVPFAVMIALAVWTLLSQLTVAVGGNLWVLEGLAALAVCSAAGAAMWRRRDREGSQDTSSSPMEVFAPAPASGLSRPMAVLVVVAVLITVFSMLSEDGLVLALGGGALGAAGLWLRRGDGDSPAASVELSRSQGLAIAGLALAVCALALLLHRADPDDAFYLNVAARAAADPSAPLLASDGIFGVEGLPLQLPVYQAHSIELLVGTLAHLLGVEPILVAHFGLVMLGAVLVVLAHARLMQQLVPHRVVFGTLAAVAMLLALGEGEQGVGVFALDRLQQGKGWLVGIGVPLLTSAALEFMQAGGRARLLRLVATAIACVGLTSSALFVAPFVATVALAAAWLGDPRRWRRLLAGLAVNLHAAVLAMWLVSPMRERMAQVEASIVDPPALATKELGAEVLAHTLGDPSLVFVLLLLVAGSLATRTQGARVAFALVGLWFGVFLSPLFAPAIATAVLPPEIYFRVSWLLPVAALAGVGFARGLDALWSLPRALAGAVGIAVLGVFVALSPAHVWSGEQTRIAAPSLKVPPLAYEAARWLNENTADGAYVLTPDEVSPWVSTFRKRNYPLFSRFIYERFMQPGIDENELYQRRTLAGYVSCRGTHLNRTDVLCYQSEVFGLSGIVLRKYGPRSQRVGEALRECGYEKVGANAQYDVWTR